MFFDFLIRKNKPAAAKEKPKAVAFVDFEHWYIALDNLYHIRPDIKGWRDELNAKYDLQEIVVFADFSNPSLRSEIARIREVTNVIIETQNSSPHITKDFTDFIMLDHIYQKTVSRPDIDVYVIFTGDGHFSSAVSFIMNRLNKPVVIYAVRDALSQQLRNTASEVFEVPAVGVSERSGWLHRSAGRLIGGGKSVSQKPLDRKKTPDKPVQSSGAKVAGPVKTEKVRPEKPEKPAAGKKSDAAKQEKQAKPEKKDRQGRSKASEPASEPAKAAEIAEKEKAAAKNKAAQKRENPKREEKPAEAPKEKKTGKAPEKREAEKSDKNVKPESPKPEQPAPKKAETKKAAEKTPDNQPEKTHEHRPERSQKTGKTGKNGDPAVREDEKTAPRREERQAGIPANEPENRPKEEARDNTARPARQAKKSQADVVSDIIEKLNREKAAQPENQPAEPVKPSLVTQAVVTDGSVSVSGAYASSLPPMPPLPVSVPADAPKADIPSAKSVNEENGTEPAPEQIAEPEDAPKKPRRRRRRKAPGEASASDIPAQTESMTSESGEPEDIGLPELPVISDQPESDDETPAAEDTQAPVSMETAAETEAEPLSESESADAADGAEKAAHDAADEPAQSGETAEPAQTEQADESAEPVDTADTAETEQPAEAAGTEEATAQAEPNSGKKKRQLPSSEEIGGMIINNLVYLSEVNKTRERPAQPTFKGTVDAVARVNKLPKSAVADALRRLLESGVISQSQQTVGDNPDVKVISVDWEKAGIPAPDASGQSSAAEETEVTAAGEPSADESPAYEGGISEDMTVPAESSAEDASGQ